MSNLAHAILIEGGNPETRMEKALALLIDHFADDPMAEQKLKAGTFEDLLILGEPPKQLFGEPLKKNNSRSLGLNLNLIEGELIPFFKQKPFASTGRACIIPDGERMNRFAQNSLLKSLEEPVAGNVLFILSDNAERLLPTIRSRCIRLWLGYDLIEQGELSDDIKQLASILIYRKKSFAEAMAIFSNYEETSEEANDLLCALQLFMRGLLVGRYSPSLIGGTPEYSDRISVASAKIQQQYVDLMRECVMSIERAIEDIKTGYRIRYSLRKMALSVRLYAYNQGGL